MSLSNVWMQTAADGLVRANQIAGIEAHQTPALTGKPARWLLDVVLPVSIGSGTREGWGVSVLHRTLIQTADNPGGAVAGLARLLVEASGPIRFRFTPFPSPDPGRHTGAEYLSPHRQ